MKKVVASSVMAMSLLFSTAVYADGVVQNTEQTTVTKDTQTSPLSTTQTVEKKYQGKIVSFDGTKIVIQTGEKTIELPVGSLTGKNVEVIVKDGVVKELQIGDVHSQEAKKKGLENALQNGTKNENAIKKIENNIDKKTLKQTKEKEEKKSTKRK
ncbi:hypothetical protein [Aneurinibacillus uraniidurans]|uniref:hypothetical protein n=1 Tax=Aneurinibacillus uraniidurans TaxID=2966586 RepID=UPI00234918D6|nr:hypothetical protein [Aneurinibacillus sp. B1]WCN37344.1 hypothetical protein PO771_16275 [Aneurinibacillus sp. B1]